MCSTSSIPPGCGEDKGTSGIIISSTLGAGVSFVSSSVEIASSTKSSAFQCKVGWIMPGLEWTRRRLCLTPGELEAERRRTLKLVDGERLDMLRGDKDFRAAFGERERTSISCGLICSHTFCPLDETVLLVDGLSSSMPGRTERVVSFGYISSMTSSYASK